MRPINRTPKGLLEFLGLKSLGKNPDVFLDDVRPTFELQPWYMGTAQERLVTGEQLDNTVLPQSFSFRSLSTFVPPDQWWLLHQVTVTAVAPANAAIRRPGAMLRSNSGLNTPLDALVVYPGFLYNSSVQLVGTEGRPYTAWLPPGAELGWCCEELNLSAMGGGDIARVNVHLTITRVGS